MKYTIKNLKCFAKENTMIFILFILCEFAAAFILFLSFGTYQNFKLVKNNDIHKSDITIGFGNIIEETTFEDEAYCEGDGSVENIDVKKFLSLLSDDTLNEIDSVMYIASAYDYTGNENFGGEPLGICFRLEYSQKEKRFVPFDTAFNNSPVLYGKGMSLKDYNNGVKNIVLPGYYTEEFVGQEMLINEESYKIIGVDSIDDFAVIPYENSPNFLSDISNIFFMTNNVISQKAYNDIETSLKEVFGDYAFIPKVDTINTKLPFYNSIMLISVILTCLAAITLSLLFRYILSTRSKTISIFRVCGCTKVNVRRIFISEVMITSLVSFFIAVVAYFGIAVNKLKSSLVYIDIVYGLKNCVILSVVYFLCIYIVLKAMIFFTLLKSPVTQMKQGGN